MLAHTSDKLGMYSARMKDSRSKEYPPERADDSLENFTVFSFSSSLQFRRMQYILFTMSNVGQKSNAEKGVFMRFKTIAVAMLSILCLVILTACQSVMMPNGTSFYQSSNAEVSLVDDTDAIKYVDYEWALITEEEAYTKNTLIITGVASNVRQATLNYEYTNAKVSDDITIFDVEISDVLVCRSGSFKQGDTVTVGVGYNMSRYSSELPPIKAGTSYLMFCYLTADQEDDVLELAEYLDCWVSAPKDLLLERIGDSYLSFDYFFSDVPNANRLVDCLGLTEKLTDTLAGNVRNDKVARAYIDEEIVRGIEGPGVSDAADALFALNKRASGYRYGLWYLATRAYLIDCDVLEAYVRNTALAYGAEEGLC